MLNIYKDKLQIVTASLLQPICMLHELHNQNTRRNENEVNNEEDV